MGAGHDLKSMNDLIRKVSDPKTAERGWSIGVRLGIAVGVLGVLALLTPLIWGAVSAGAGLLVLGALAVVGIGVMQVLPLLGQKWENKILAMRKSEARANPIEQLQNYLTQKATRVNEFKKAVSAIGTQIKGLEDMIEDRKKNRPGYDASKQERSVQAMRAAHAQLVTKYKNADAALGQLREVIEDKKFEWSFGQAGQAAIKSLNATSGQELLDEMLADEAFASVRDNFNSVFAELETEAARLTNQNQLSFEGDGMTLDLSAINLPQVERLGA